ncbi:MAG: hypothetical protein Q9224_003179 [Gallowayella concinna]
MDDQLPPPPYSLEDPSRQQRADTANQGLTPAHHATAFVSGAAYFEMRPASYPKPSNTLPCHIAVLADTTTTDLPMPQPTRILTDRDVNPHDWMTFVNHVVPYHTDTSSASAVTKETGKKRSVTKVSEKDPMAWPSEEAQRQQLVKTAVEEWNQGFFLPRGIEIVVRVEVTPRQPADPGLCSSRPAIPRTLVETVPSRQTMDQEGRVKRNKDTELGMALHRAVKKQDIKMTKLLLEAGADPDAKSSWEAPSIVETVKHADIRLLELLLEYNPNVEAHASGEGTALYIAVAKGKTDMVKALLAKGANPNKRPTGVEPALYKAVSKHHDDIVELLLKRDDVKIDDTPPGGTTAMYLAAKKGNVELIKILVAAGAKVDARPLGVNTAMFEAAKKGNYNVCQILLELGAEADARTTGGETALWHVIGKSDLGLIRLLLDYGASSSTKRWGGETVLQKAVSKGRQDQVELLLQYTHKATTRPAIP